ncbi:Alpha/Beta hydrolase protein [Entophlyctis helioformis]|nr:Alpha/Beta hydrolase protein [Entophlyctis helioformis]
MRLPNSHRLAASMDYRGEELKFRSHSGLRIAAKRWGYADGFPLLALHGWYDNCATWEVLVPILVAKYPSIRFDMSDHRGLTSAYSRLFDIEDALAVVNALGWKEYAILGHSMGGVNAVYLAGLFPKQVKHVVAIDTIAMIYYEPAEHTDAIIQAIHARADFVKRDPAASTKRVFATVEEAAVARSAGKYPLSLPSARLMAARGVKPATAPDGSGRIVGYMWSSDSRIPSPTNPFKTTKGFILDVLGRIECPVLNIMADHTMRQSFAPAEIQAAFRGHLHQHRTQGISSHHLHMETASATVIAHLIAGFWNKANSGTLPGSRIVLPEPSKL